MSPKLTALAITVFILKCLAVHGVASEGLARDGTHGEHILRVCVALSKISLVVTQLISTLLISQA
jgi:hypothetical protein